MKSTCIGKRAAFWSKVEMVRVPAAALLGLMLACQVPGPGSNQDNDPDDDGLTTSEEELLGTDPTRPDTDGDGLWDGDEIDQETSPLAADSDGDGLPDGQDPDPLVPEVRNTNTDDNDNAGNDNLLNDNTVPANENDNAAVQNENENVLPQNENDNMPVNDNAMPDNVN